MTVRLKRHTQFSAQAVMAFLSSLSIAPKTASQARDTPERRDLFLLIEEEIEQFFEMTPDLKNLDPEQMRELEQFRQIFRGMYHDADLVMLDPAKERPQ